MFHIRFEGGTESGLNVIRESIASCKASIPVPATNAGRRCSQFKVSLLWLDCSIYCVVLVAGKTHGARNQPTPWPLVIDFYIHLGGWNSWLLCFVLFARNRISFETDLWWRCDAMVDSNWNHGFPIGFFVFWLFGRQQHGCWWKCSRELIKGRPCLEDTQQNLTPFLLAFTWGLYRIF